MPESLIIPKLTKEQVDAWKAEIKALGGIPCELIKPVDLAILFRQVEDAIEQTCPPVAELIKAKERLTEAFMWAKKAIESPSTHS